MHNEESRSDLGNIQVHRNVVASIASLAALEIDGVKRTGGDFRSGFLEFVGKKNLAVIKVDFDKNHEVKIDVPLVIKYGYNIPEVANSVQENIRHKMEEMTNLTIKGINVSVQSIERG